MEKLVENQGLSHLALHIFSFLRFDTPYPEDLNNCRLVCKAWQTVIDTSLFYWHKRLAFLTVKKWMTRTHWEEFDFAFDSVLGHKVWKDVRDFTLLLEEYLEEVEDCNEHDPLHYYCQQGNTKAVSIMIRFYMNLDTKDIHETTPLMVACSLGHTDIVNLFLSVDLEGVRIDYNMRDDRNKTALLYASKKGQMDVVKLLFKKSEDRQINLNAVCDRNMNVFGWGIWSRNDDLLDFLINNRGKYSIATDHLINGFNNHGGTYYPFLIACWKKNLKAVNYFLQKSKIIDLNQKDNHGRSGFFIACMKGHVEIIKLLSKNAASKKINIKETSYFGSNGLMVAAECNQEAVVKYMLSHLETFKYDIRVAVDDHGRNAFLIACSRDSLDVAKIILDFVDTAEDKKSMLTFQDYSGNNALMLTIIYRHSRNRPYKTLKYLLEQMVLHGIPLSDRNNEEEDDMTVFDLICTYGDIPGITAYMQVVENHVDYTDQWGETGFIKACKYNRHEIVEYIIKEKSSYYFSALDTLDLNATDDEWMTGFMWACKLKCAKVVEVILKYAKSREIGPIDLIANDKQGRTGYDLWPKKIPFPMTEKYLNKRHIYFNLGTKMYERYLGTDLA